MQPYIGSGDYCFSNSLHMSLLGADHYIVVLSMEEDHVLVHDPKGFPCTALPVENLLKAWRPASARGYPSDEKNFPSRVPSSHKSHRDLCSPHRKRTVSCLVL